MQILYARRLYSQKIFLIDLVSPFARNIRKEVTKSPVPYFWDMGLRNYSLGIFGNVNNPAEFGFLFENFVFLLLKSRTALGSTKLNFWRTKEKAEVDFVLVSGKTVVPVEVKYKSLKREEISRFLRSFIQKYKPAEAYIINLNLKKTIKIGETSLSFLPFYELLLKKF
jgi:hypothetical protein